MGCFSFICQQCGRGIKSSSHDGEECTLWLLKDGTPIQEMTGEYDSYGRVFIGPKRKDKKLRDSHMWDNPVLREMIDSSDNEDAPDDLWSAVCDLMHDGYSEEQRLGNGIAAIHTSCFDTFVTTRGEFHPTIKSEQDPDQGWGRPQTKPIKGYDAERSHNIEYSKRKIRELDIKIIDFKSRLRQLTLNADAVALCNKVIVETNKEITKHKKVLGNLK